MRAQSLDASVPPRVSMGSEPRNEKGEAEARSSRVGPDTQPGELRPWSRLPPPSLPQECITIACSSHRTKLTRPIVPNPGWNAWCHARASLSFFRRPPHMNRLPVFHDPPLNTSLVTYGVLWPTRTHILGTMFKSSTGRPGGAAETVIPPHGAPR